MKETLIDYMMNKDPTTVQAKLRQIWPEIEKLLEQKIPAKEIWRGIKEVHKIDCSYAWFARFVKAQKMGLLVVSHAAKKSTEQKDNPGLAKGRQKLATEALQKMSNKPPKKSDTEQQELDRLFNGDGAE